MMLSVGCSFVSSFRSSLFSFQFVFFVLLVFQFFVFCFFILVFCFCVLFWGFDHLTHRSKEITTSSSSLFSNCGNVILFSAA